MPGNGEKTAQEWKDKDILSKKERKKKLAKDKEVERKSKQQKNKQRKLIKYCFCLSFCFIIFSLMGFLKEGGLGWAGMTRWLARKAFVL